MTPALRILSHSLVMTTLLLLAGCKAGAGDDCVCEDDCRAGLVCAVNGAMLKLGECASGGKSEPGVCVDPDDIPESKDPLPDTRPTDVHTAKRDIGPWGSGPESGSSSESTTTTTTSSSTSTDTGTSTTTSTDTGTTGTTGTGTGSTGATGSTGSTT